MWLGHFSYCEWSTGLRHFLLFPALEPVLVVRFCPCFDCPVRENCLWLYIKANNFTLKSALAFQSSISFVLRTFPEVGSVSIIIFILQLRRLSFEVRCYWLFFSTQRQKPLEAWMFDHNSNSFFSAPRLF